MPRAQRQLVALPQSKQGTDEIYLADGTSAKEETGIAIGAESGSANIPLPSDTPLTKSKAIRRLAALQVCSPVHAISPVPLRRRLQNRSASAIDENGSEVHMLNSNNDVICIDC